MFQSDYTPYVLIVDDMEDNRDLLASILGEAGYHIQTAADGLAAIDMVEQIKPDLILMDVNMPRMDGFEACRELRKRHAGIDIPIVFLTGQNSMEAIVHGFELGARDYLTKPFNPDELLARVRTHVQLELAQQKLADLADKLAKYLSPQVYASIFKGEKDARIESYEKTLSVCFTDIVIFTPTVEKMAPEELTNWLNHYLSEMARIVIKHGGTLDKYIGDAVMVFFGDPASRGVREDTIYCVKMAQEMIFRTKVMGLDIRIGISTGECTVGNFGSFDRMDYTIIGKEVNVASRLEGSAVPGGILISESTYQHVKDEVACEPNGNIHVKGLERSLMTYWVKSGG